MNRLRLVLAVLPTVLAAVAHAAPAGSPASAAPAQSAPSPPVGGATITLDVDANGDPSPPVQCFYFGQPSAMGMSGVPDMHTAVMQQPDGSYKLWIAGRFESDSVQGATGLITTSDFLAYRSGYSTDSTGLVVKPVFVPSCRGATDSAACWNDFDAVYAGADLVFTGTDGDLRMLYHGACGYFGGLPPDSSTATWCQVGIARSSDGGITWSDRAPVISGSDQKPATDPSIGGVYGAVEPGAIVTAGFIYCFYSYFSLPVSGKTVPPVIQVARAPVSGDGAPGTWWKYDGGWTETQPGLLGAPGTTSLGVPIVPGVTGCTRPAQPWPVYSSYLGRWVLVFIAKEGWFFTTSTDLVGWDAPVRFFPSPGDSALSNFTNGAPTYENVILVTPGNREQVIGQTGLVVYAYTPSWGHDPHELWVRPFKFDFSPASVGPEEPVAPRSALARIYPNPFRATTVVEYRLAAAVPVRLSVFDVRGREVATLVDQVMPAGTHSARLDGAGLAPGVYECRLAAGADVRSRRVVLVR